MASSLYARLGRAVAMFAVIVGVCFGLFGIMLLVEALRGRGNPSSSMLIGFMSLLFLASSSVAVGIGVSAWRKAS